MKRLIEALKTVSNIYTEYDIAGVHVYGGKLMEVHVDKFKTIPNEPGVIYTRRKGEQYPFEKSVLVDGVKVYAIGTMQDMRNEFAEQQQAEGEENDDTASSD